MCKLIYIVIQQNQYKLFKKLNKTQIKQSNMKHDDTYKLNNAGMESTRLPVYNSKGSLEHPSQMRVQGRYGETSIPANVFLNQASKINSQQNAAYQLGASSSQPQLNAQVPYQQIRYNSANQVHHSLPLYNYGIQQNYQPCGPSYRLPVYYQQPMQIREEWQRPLDPHVKQQQWRFVKTQDKGGIVKYVPRDQDFVPTYQSQWDKHYDPKVSSPPIIPPSRQKRTCCTPLLFALLGLLALIGLIVGLVLLLSAHGTQASSPLVSNPNVVNPTPGKIIEEIPAVPVPTTPSVIITPPIPITRPTFADPISVAPSQKVATAQPIITSSSSYVDKQQAVKINYGYKENTYTTYDSSINYDNDYQLRNTGSYQVNTKPAITQSTITQPYFSQPTVTQPYISQPTVVQPSIGFNAIPVSTQPAITTVVNTPANTSPTYSTSTTNATTQPQGGSYDFRVPQGYRIDQNGMIVKI